MSQVLTVPTHFNDIGELSQGFLDRVEQDTLILYGPVAYEDGSEIEFAVLLADGTAALEGTGRVRAAVDGGADRVPETRYDVVVEALKLDGRYEVVFERLVLARQAVSDPPPVDPEEDQSTNEMDAAPGAEGSEAESADEPSRDEPVVDEARAYVNDIELTADEVFSLAPDEVYSVAPEEADSESVPPEESEPDTEPPEPSDDTDTFVDDARDEEDEDDEDEDELATVVAAVDAEAMMADAAAAEWEEEPSLDLSPAAQATLEANADASDERAPAEEAYDEAIAGTKLELDPDYAFEHGIATEPQVGMPVPIPSMAAPPDAPPAPPRLRLAEPPDGLSRPSLAHAEDSLFASDGEVSDVHTTGLFAYEDELPIPSRPPLPGPNGSGSAARSEARDESDVEESEPPESNDDEYEEVRLSDFAGAVEEG